MSDVIPDDILNQAMDDHDAKTEKHEPRAAVLQAAKSGVLKSTNQAMHGDEAKDKQDVPDFWATHTQKGASFQEFAAATREFMRVHGLDLKKDKALEEAKSGVLRDDMVAKHVEEANFRREQDEFAAAFSRTGPFDTGRY